MFDVLNLSAVVLSGLVTTGALGLVSRFMVLLRDDTRLLRAVLLDATGVLRLVTRFLRPVLFGAISRDVTCSPLFAQ